MGSDNKTCKPLNLFFSYGHEKKDQFITCKIFHAVKDRGHHVWRDTEKITFSSSWRQKIENGVLHSNGVIGCLSAYSCRPGGVCLDELSIAVGVRGGRRVYSILLDKEGDVNPPQSVADRQWLDMSDWREKRAQGSDVFEPWFAARMQELFAVVESPENVEFVGQITTIRQRLTVYYGTARQNKLLQNPFIGRAWLTQRVDAWLDDENAPRTLFLTGAPAVGKSAWACHYAQYNGRVAAALFLDSDCDYFNDPRTVIQTLAFLLACRLPEYREILMEFLPDNRKETAKMSEQELFSCLLAEPFQHIVDGAHRHMAIVIDGLDEAGHETNALAKVLFRYAAQLPNWIRFLLCGRDVPALRPFTETALRVELPSGSAENLADMRAFFCFRLEKTFGSDPQWGEALERMTARSEGIALYAQLLCDMLLDKKTLDCEEFPKGLTGMFTVWFEHYIPDVEEFRRFFRPAICCILGMPGQALPIATLRRVMGWRAAQTNDFLLRLQVLLRRKNDVHGEETVTFDHAFVREWLSSEAAGKFYCPPEDGRELLAEGIYAAFEKDAEGLTCWEAIILYDYGKSNPFQLPEENIMGLLRYNEKYAQKIADSFALEDKVMMVAELNRKRGKLNFANLFLQEILEKSDKRLERHSDAETLRRRAICLNKYGYNLREQCRYHKAQDTFSEYRCVLREIYKKTGLIEDKRDYLMSDITIGDTIVAGVKNEDEWDSFIGIRASLDKAISKALRAADKHYTRTQEKMEELTTEQDGKQYLVDLALCYKKKGHVQKDSQSALFWFEEEAKTYEKAYAEQSTESVNEKLIDCYIRIGDIQKELENDEGAQDAYKSAYEKLEKNPELSTEPDEMAKQAVQLDRNGDLLLRLGKWDEALDSYCASRKQRKQLVNVRSTPQTQMDLAASCSKVASMLNSKEKRKEAEEYYHEAYCLLENLRKNTKSDRILSAWYECINNLNGICIKTERLSEAAQCQQKHFDVYFGEEFSKLNKFISRDPMMFSFSLIDLGGAYERAGDMETAIEKYRQALKKMESISSNYGWDRIGEEMEILRTRIAELEQKTE